MKVAVIGLDGATFDVIMPLLKQRKLPVLKRLIDNGARAKLMSTVPSVTAAAWVSAFTGNNPGKHGIFDFFTVESKDMRLVNSTDIRCRTLWDLLNESSKITIIIDVPLTYPPKKVRGAIISGMFVPNEESEFVYPSELKREIVDAGFRIERKRYYLSYFSDKDGLFKEILDMSQRTCEATLYLINKLKWDFLMVVFTAPDRAQHFYWKYMDATHPRYDSESGRKCGKVIPEVYEKLDTMLGKLLENFDEDTLVVVMSDHGFGPVHTDLYVNRLLMQLGLLELRSGSFLHILLRRTNIQRLAVRLLKALHLESLAKSSIAFRVGSRLFGTESLDRSINFERTEAFFPSRSGQYIKINLKGRDPGGTVEPGKPYEKLRSYLAKELCDLRDPKSGKQVVEKVFMREEIYHGPEVSRAPDLFLIPTTGYALQAELSQGELLMPSREEISDVSGGHRPEGVLIVAGPPVRRGVSLDEVNIVDIAPTVLYAAGAPIPRDMDGSVLSEMFDPAFLASHPQMHSDRIRWSKVSGKPYSPEEEQEITKRLRALGYI